MFSWNDELLETYNTIWDKVTGDTKNQFGIQPLYNKTLLKTKIKSYND